MGSHSPVSDGRPNGFVVHCLLQSVSFRGGGATNCGRDVSGVGVGRWRGEEGEIRMIVVARGAFPVSDGRITGELYVVYAVSLLPTQVDVAGLKKNRRVFFREKAWLPLQDRHCLKSQT